MLLVTSSRAITSFFYIIQKILLFRDWAADSSGRLGSTQGPGYKSWLVYVQNCNSVALVRDWSKMGHVTQFWPMRSLSQEPLGKLSSLWKEEETQGAFCFWHLDVSEKNVKLRAVVATLWPRRGQFDAKARCVGQASFMLGSPEKILSPALCLVAKPITAGTAYPSAYYYVRK